ncbi:PAP-associated domain-containing protein [Caenorhabditis elegans]|uniref:PAP-associated domain-containing protein n=1 Tax=Caenorhabditis elegans TaxID=6239 RepID=P91361_CAEEL|nr:PAP-associated domain-containing protein [Caenorhabditis elegans]CCD63902.1 PAP-associated domain-containing protein [Caenorhabditis elegans]|eukprot:NP_491621.1 Poly(U) Polymerase [Caenorhabditis elegans]
MAPRTYASVLTTPRGPAPLALYCPEAPECPKLEAISNLSFQQITQQAGTSNDQGFEFENTYVEHRINQEIESFVDTHHQEPLRKAAAQFRAVMKQEYPDSTCFITGSYPAGVDIFSSDIDFTVKVPTLEGANPFLKLMQLRKELSCYYTIFSKAYVQKGNIPVLQLMHAETKVSIDVTIDNDTSKRNTQLLAFYSQLDTRFPLLCKAMKAWAASCGVEGASRGRLNSFSLCLMLIHYLQTVQVLLNIQEIFPELNGDIVVEDDNYMKRDLKIEILEKGAFDFNQNTSSLAVLFIGFMKYYSEFNFKWNWISIKHGNVLKKKWSKTRVPKNGMPKDCRFIVVADPLLEIPRNCAGTVRQQNYMERIQLEFREEYERILKRKTIFNLYQCNWSRKLRKEGMERDLQIMILQDELRKLRIANLPTEEEVPWGTVVDFTSPRTFSPTNQHPKVFWCSEQTTENQRRDNLWPELLRTNPYAIFENLI